MNALLLVLMLVSAGVVMMRSTRQIASLSHRKWEGHLLKFTGLSLAHALASGGAVGIALGWHAAPVLLLLGVAGWALFDRRGDTP